MLEKRSFHVVRRVSYRYVETRRCSCSSGRAHIDDLMHRGRMRRNLNCRRTDYAVDASRSVQPSGNLFEICTLNTFAGLKAEGPSWVCTWS